MGLCVRTLLQAEMIRNLHVIQEVVERIHGLSKPYFVRVAYHGEKKGKWKFSPRQKSAGQAAGACLLADSVAPVMVNPHIVPITIAHRTEPKRRSKKNTKYSLGFSGMIDPTPPPRLTIATYTPIIHISNP
eukprot:2579652-Prymnesium_polylepis.1